MTESFLRTDDTDRMGDALLELARELWVATERNLILETVLERRGLLQSGEIDRLQPDAELQQRLDRERRDYMGRLLATLAGDDPRVVEAEAKTPRGSLT